jgi:hypothetical protein
MWPFSGKDPAEMRNANREQEDEKRTESNYQNTHSFTV